MPPRGPGPRRPRRFHRRRHFGPRYAHRRWYWNDYGLPYYYYHTTPIVVTTPSDDDSDDDEPHWLAQPAVLVLIALLALAVGYSMK